MASNERKPDIRRMIACTLLIAVGAVAPSCAYRAAPRTLPIPRAAAKPAPSMSQFVHVQHAKALPEETGRDALRARIIQNVRERIMSHRDIERDALRMIDEVRPIVEEASKQPAARAGLAQFASDAGLSVEAARQRWIRLQLADLMLESGGDPDALSTSAAAGAAQWLAGTARGVGLSVDLGKSNAFTRQITALRCRIAWIKYLGRSDADRSAPGAPALVPADIALLPKLNAELQDCRLARRRCDARYDPRAAIFAQTRYLMRLYPKFPSPDWLFQAYHGGEAGVSKTLRLYVGANWPGSAASAIRAGENGSPLTFDTLYFETTPYSHAEAFAYLFGRSDDHRHYWYKLLAADQVLAAYRKSPQAFHKEWESSLPGRRIEAHWYPDDAENGITNLASLQQRHDLVSISREPGLSVRPPRDDPANTALYTRLRPAANGALVLVVSEFGKAGGKSVLQTGDLTLTQEYVERAKLLHPSRPLPLPLFPPDIDTRPGGGPPRSFDYHTTGLVFDLLRPSDATERKILEYTLDRLEARGLLSALLAKDGDERRYHIVPHPAYVEVFARISAHGEWE